MMLLALGAEVLLTPKETAVAGALAKAEEIIKDLDGKGFMLQQFANPAGPKVTRGIAHGRAWCIFFLGGGSRFFGMSLMMCPFVVSAGSPRDDGARDLARHRRHGGRVCGRRGDGRHGHGGVPVHQGVPEVWPRAQEPQAAHGACRIRSSEKASPLEWESVPCSFK
jgi:hypothetical protein